MKKFFIAVFMAALMMSHTNIFAETININQASLEQMVENLNGVGMHRAKAIIDYHEQHGEFESINDLLQVKGIWQSTLEKNRDSLLIE
jgi:competence protein ComEA